MHSNNTGSKFPYPTVLYKAICATYRIASLRMQTAMSHA